jgi:hypothetical protein
MGRVAEKPRCNIFSFRADEETAEVIRIAASKYPTMGHFLLDAAQIHALQDAEARLLLLTRLAEETKS